MLVPGSNVLGIALSVIGKQRFSYKAFVSRSLNTVGQDVPVYAQGIPLMGSVQPPPRELFDRYGLDLQRDYLMFYVQKSMLDVTRDVSGDRIEFANKNYQVLTKTNWMPIDGWISLLAVQIPDEPC